MKNSADTTDKKMRWTDTDQIENFILAYKSARNDNSKSEEILLKLISELE